jgi:hypothetical protein
MIFPVHVHNVGADKGKIVPENFSSRRDTSSTFSTYSIQLQAESESISFGEALHMPLWI